MALPNTSRPSSPVSPSSSYELIEPETFSISDGSDSDTGNDIVLSPNTTWASITNGSEGSEASHRGGFNVEENDFVLVPAGSSLFGPSRSRTASVSSPAQSVRHSSMSFSAPVDDRDDDKHSDVQDTPDRDDNLGVSTSGVGSLSVPPIQYGAETPSPPFPVFSEDTPRATTPAANEPLPLPATIFNLGAGSVLQDRTNANNPTSSSTPSNVQKASQITTSTMVKAPAALSKGPKPKKKRPSRAQRRARKIASAAGATGPGDSPAQTPKKSPKPKAAPAKLPPLILPLDDEAAALHKDAVEHMNKYLESPPENPTTAERLETARALLVELGITMKPSLQPQSVSAARKLLNLYVHLNVLDYTAFRGKGLEALRGVMHPSKAALKRDVRKRKAALKDVKALGLRDLLVTTRFGA